MSGMARKGGWRSRTLQDELDKNCKWTAICGSPGKKSQNGSGRWHRGKGDDEWTKRDDGGKRGGKKGSKGSKSDGHSDKDRGNKGKRKGKGKGKSETRYCYDCGEQGHTGVNCPYKWANSIDEEDDQTSSWESEPEGENAEELASLETPDEEGEWWWPEKSRVTRWGRRIDSRPAFHYLAEDGPKLNERCEQRQECDRVLAATVRQTMRTWRTEKWDLTTEARR